MNVEELLIFVSSENETRKNVSTGLSVSGLEHISLVWKKTCYQQVLLLAFRLKIKDKLQRIVRRKRANREWVLNVSRTCNVNLSKSGMDSVFKQDMQNTFIFGLDGKLAQNSVLCLF